MDAVVACCGGGVSLLGVQSTWWKVFMSNQVVREGNKEVPEEDPMETIVLVVDYMAVESLDIGPATGQILISLRS